MIKSLVLLFLSHLIVHSSLAQDWYSEAGIGIGNVVGEDHRLGKAEIYLNVLGSLPIGDIGIDLATGGNFIPGENSVIANTTETLSPNDVKFTAIMAFYRIPVFKRVYVEPRLGYANLFHLIHADNQRKISASTFSYGLGVGANLADNLSLSFRYQHLGSTPTFEGPKDGSTLISRSQSVQVVLLRLGYRLHWNKIF